MSSSEHPESPRKRQKLSPEAQTATMPEPTELPSADNATQTTVRQDRAVHATREAEVGITDYVSVEAPGFNGILKKRYTDFLVNEILPSGQVVHLRNPGHAALSSLDGKSKLSGSSEQTERGTPSSSLPGTSSTNSQPAARTDHPKGDEMKPTLPENQASGESTSPVSIEDISKLMICLDEKAVEELLALHNKILAAPNARPRDHGDVSTAIPSEKSVRTTLHEDVRRIFNSRIESSTDMERALMIFSAAPPQHKNLSKRGEPHGNQMRRQERLGWAERGGEYLHFSLYKENKDTMEVISYLTRQLKVNAKSFQFAGTKDRRAVTVQRVSAYRVEENRLAYQNRMLRNASIGDFGYQALGLELGDLKGNEFVITLRDCQWEHAQNLSIKEKISSAEHAVSQACRDLHEKGFFNYYGLQRFGTFSTRTDAIGLKLLQGDFQGACEAILHYSPHVLAAAYDHSSTEQIGSDDKARAEAIELFQKTGRAHEALDKLPRKFSAEGNLIRHLGKNKRDYSGAIQMIQRNLKLMYVHAYQSLVWNFAVGERWKLFGNQVVEGDLVLIKEHEDKESTTVVVDDEVDADGEIVVQPAGEDRARGFDDVFERARALSVGEAASGKYSIFDIVLPLPGYDVLYPANAMVGFYQSFMSSKRGGGLDPFDMRRKQRDFSLSGSYRKMVARIESGYEVQVRAYKDDNEQFVDTDLDVIRKQGAEKETLPAAGLSPRDGDKLAVVLQLQLGSSQYATMALRELSQGGVQAYKPDFGGGR